MRAGRLVLGVHAADRAGRLGDYLLFGLIAGSGLLSKYGFAAYLLIVFACALLQPALRARLIDWRMLVGVGAAAAVCAPFVYWLLADRHDLVAVFDNTVAREASDRLKATVSGLWRAVYAPIGFLLPLLVILPIAFPGMLRAAWARCGGA